MSSTLASRPAPAARHDDLDNYDVDDFSDDPFGSPPPDEASKKRKEPDSGLGIDEEVSVQKRARVPNVKLDEERLLGPAGIPKLRQRAGNLKIKGKGHEFSDASRLLSFYQLWLDDLFPKAKFLDALTMVEKAGHKKRVMVARNDFINEGKVNDTAEEEAENDEDFDAFSEPQHPEPNTAAPAIERPKTPTQDPDIPDDDDLYDVTPRASRPIVPIRNNAPDEDDLDALIAEAESSEQAKASRPAAEPEEDGLDALIAEAESGDQSRPQPPGEQKSGPARGDDFADEEAAMQEMEGLW
ncbi:Fc.00g035440.m01.CDS01 [Cosmosporella sp. VM-42]